MPLGSLDLRLVMFHAVIRRLPGALGRANERVAGICVFLGKLGSAVVSWDLGALAESESDADFLRGFLASVKVCAWFVASVLVESICVASACSDKTGCTALRLGWIDDAPGDAARVSVVVRLEARLADVLVGAVGAMMDVLVRDAVCTVEKALQTRVVGESTAVERTPSSLVVNMPGNRTS